MKILTVGSGGREHAIVWRLAQDAQAGEKHELYCAPGNAGTAAIATNVPIAADDIDGIVAWSKAERPDLVVVGPEAPLVKGLVDALESEGVTAFGPVAAGAKIEGSKKFAKEVMEAAGVPTARAATFTDAAAAKAALASFGLPVVVKADGLAAGKGVVVAETREATEAAIDDMLVANKFGAAGAEVLLEEFLDGEECSILALTDGKTAVLLPSSQDHKRAFDGDQGPNTGGMGAYSPAPVVTDDLLPFIKEKIVLPVIRELGRRGIVYRGILYAGLMVMKEREASAPVKVVEFNARFGDPETEVVLPRLGGVFARALLHAATGSLSEEDVIVRPECAATVILASSGYPGAYEKGKDIAGLDEAAKQGGIVFHCGTKRTQDGRVQTAGGRVLAATGLGKTLREAVDRAYAGADAVSFDGKFCRRDIAHRAFDREGAGEGDASASCTHDCSSCKSKCAKGGAAGGAASFAAPKNAASTIKRVIAVSSGKGGVGKSFVTTMLAVAAMRRGLKVGILDADITGPSIPKAFGLAGGTYQSEKGIEPQTTNCGIRVISLNMLVDDPTDPVVWRGPVIAGAVKQFWSDVHWGELDVMFVDMPPGTGDVPLTVFQSLPVDGVVVVSTPQELVGEIVSKAVKMAGMLKKEVVGLVENMSSLVCPHCGKEVPLFGESRVEELAGRFGIAATARLPVSQEYARAVDTGAVEFLDVPQLETVVGAALARLGE